MPGTSKEPVLRLEGICKNFGALEVLELVELSDKKDLLTGNLTLFQIGAC